MSVSLMFVSTWSEYERSSLSCMRFKCASIWASFAFSYRLSAACFKDFYPGSDLEPPVPIEVIDPRSIRETLDFRDIPDMLLLFEI